MSDIINHEQILNEFINKIIITKEKSKIKKTEVLEIFTQYFMIKYGKKIKRIKKEIIIQYFNEKYGNYRNGWHGLGIKYDEFDDDDNDNATDNENMN